MVKLWIPLTALLLLGCSSSEKEVVTEIIEDSYLELIPAPLEMTQSEDEYFWFYSNTTYTYSQGTEENTYLEDLINYQLDIASNSNVSEVNIKVGETDFLNTSESEEAYEINATVHSLEIIGKTDKGLARAFQTIRQLLPVAFHEGEKRNKWKMPVLSIKDAPAFEHRGMLLDVCRHFFDKEIVKEYIDLLAFYKMNTLHFHLTEDQGWRMPIDKYPLLNEVSSWREDSTGEMYGGFYTKEDLKEIVAYAEERKITVIPEIELPGHSQAALAAYPHLSCTGGPIEVANDWGVFKEIYCAGNDSTFIFLEDVLTEVMEIFPSKYIHIGGDEAPKYRWENCPKSQQRMKEEGLKDEHELQSYFIERIEKFLNENGRELIGWDEILEGGLSPNATVQSWRGFEGGIEAAEAEHRVIMSPTSHCYLDYSLKSIDLEKIYSFDPIPEELDEVYHQYIIGGECNMWTEHVPDKENLDSKVFPRMIGLAEVLWTYDKSREFDVFYNRLQTHYPVLKFWGINYGLETIGANINLEFDDEVSILLESNLDNLSLKYKWGNESDWKDYQEPFSINDGKLMVQAYKNEELYGEPITQSFVKHKALNAGFDYKYKWSDWYAGYETNNLVDGRVGSLDFRDGTWHGYWGTDMISTIDLGQPEYIITVQMNFYQYANSWIFLPEKVRVEYSVDSLSWTVLGEIENEEPDLSNVKSIKEVSLSSDRKLGVQARYIRVTAENIGKVPNGHEAAGSPAWIFIDEIIVR